MNIIMIASIYKIYCESGDFCSVGSTTRLLRDSKIMLMVIVVTKEEIQNTYLHMNCLTHMVWRIVKLNYSSLSIVIQKKKLQRRRRNTSSNSRQSTNKYGWENTSRNHYIIISAPVPLCVTLVDLPY